MDLLKKLCNIHSPSGEESNISDFLIKYINQNQHNWKVKPKIYAGENFQDNIILVFGNPRTAIFAHMDSIGFTVKYNNEIVKIGGPVSNERIKLIGEDSHGKIEGELIKGKGKNKGKLYISYHREIDRGTSLTFKVNFRETKHFVESSYLDNRLGVWNCLQIASKIKDGIIVFSSWEEHGGGSVGYLGKFIYENYKVRQALISDITWITEGIEHGKGCVISLRDSGIPRKKYINKIRGIIEESKIPYQLEVESTGGSDGNQLQKSSYPWDWCFIGAAEDNVHSPNEKVHKDDIKSMQNIYLKLIEEL